MSDTPSNHFGGRSLPRLTATSPDRVYVPYDRHFPAIDMIWKYGYRIFGVMFHASCDSIVTHSSVDLCQEAGWFESFETVNLLHLSSEH